MPLQPRFVILSNARSGTTLLVASLNQHPEILCRTEIFHANAHQLSAEQVALRQADPLRFTHEMLEPRDGHRCVGFKMWRAQNPRMCEYLLGRPDVAKIIIERPNKLAQYASLRIATRSGIWNIKSAARQERLGQRRRQAQSEEFKPDFDSLRFLTYLYLGQMLFDRYRKAAKGPRLDITYNDLVRVGFGPVLEFLGVSARALPPATARLQSADVLSRYKPDARYMILKTLATIGRPDWTEEDLTRPGPHCRRLKPDTLLSHAAAELPRSLLRLVQR